MNKILNRLTFAYVFGMLGGLAAAAPPQAEREAVSADRGALPH
jgi:hypothetical protein